VVCHNFTFERAGLQADPGKGRNSAEKDAIYSVRAALNILARQWGIT
jgi:hypothetical protein